MQQALKYGFSVYGTPKTGVSIIRQTYDDGYYQKGYPLSGVRFIDNGDGTISDQATGLMWPKSGLANVVTTPATAHTTTGSYWRYTWENALLYCERLSLAGHTDWRLPNCKELVTIVDFSRVAPSIDITVFDDTASTVYLTGTTYFSIQTACFQVNFNGGALNIITKSSNYYVRPVRNI